jgi:hypothetical protein
VFTVAAVALTVFRVHSPARSRRIRMDDVLYLGLTGLFFLLALLVLKGVDRL